MEENEEMVRPAAAFADFVSRMRDDSLFVIFTSTNIFL
jgi:hypothetical protein